MLCIGLGGPVDSNIDGDQDYPNFPSRRVRSAIAYVDATDFSRSIISGRVFVFALLVRFSFFLRKVDFSASPIPRWNLVRSLGYVFARLGETRYATTPHTTSTKQPAGYVQHFKNRTDGPLGVAHSIRAVRTVSLGAEAEAETETHSVSVSRGRFGRTELIASEYAQTKIN